MPEAVLSLTRPALLVVDVLSGVFALPAPVFEEHVFVSNVRRLLDWARDERAPVVFVQHEGPSGSPFGPGQPGRAIDPRLCPFPGETVVSKQHPDAFQGSALEECLGALRTGDLVVCGFATEGCVDTTVRSAYSRGFSVVLVADAHTTTNGPVLDAGLIIAHHNQVLGRFARVVHLEQIVGRV